MLMMQYVHERMLELVRKSYPEDYERYRHFYIRFEFKEKKSSYSKYIFEKRILQITTLSREPADILLFDPGAGTSYRYHPAERDA